VRRCLSVGHESAHSVLCAIGGCWEIKKCKEIIVVFIGSGCCCHCQVHQHCGIVVDCAVQCCLSVGHESARSVLCAIKGCWEIEKCKEIIIVVVFVGSGHCCRCQVRRRGGVIGAAVCRVVRGGNRADTLRRSVKVDTRWWWCQGESGSVSGWVRGCD